MVVVEVIGVNKIIVVDLPINLGPTRLLSLLLAIGLRIGIGILTRSLIRGLSSGPSGCGLVAIGLGCGLTLIVGVRIKVEDGDEALNLWRCRSQLIRNGRNRNRKE